MAEGNTEVTSEHHLPECSNKDDVNTLAVSMEEKGYTIVAAIDFGTTFSGYAYALMPNMENIYINRNWGQTQGFLSLKTLTCLLLKPNGEFVAFGFKAVSKYNDLTEEETSKHYYFHRFKMKLHENKNLSTDIVLQDVNGKTQPAVNVFSQSLHFMKEHLLHHLTERLGYKPDAETIRWVITVPAIWDENAKNFMREAAYQGGLIDDTHSNKLLIALEPEAASLTCRTIQSNNVRDNAEIKTATPTFEPGTKYLVVDAGGGTIDIVAHKVMQDGKIREILGAMGGPWGGTVIDQQFIDLLSLIFGPEFMNAFSSKFPKDYVELVLDFEIKKRGDSDTIRVSLPHNFCNFSHDGKSVQECVTDYAQISGTLVRFSSGKLILSPEIVDSLFKDTLSKINDYIGKLLQRPKLRDLKYIFLVGGFSESTKLQASIKKAISDRVTVLVPEDANLAVVKGAVAFGSDPSSIFKRICRYTYGIGFYVPFEDGKHRPDLKMVAGEKIICRNIFEVWKRRGDVIKHNHVWKRTYTPMITKQKVMEFEFFKTSKKEVEYTDEEGVEKCGSLVVKLPNIKGDMEREVDLEVIFGGTEIKVVAFDHTAKARCETYVDFLTR